MALEKGNTEVPIRDFRRHENPADGERIEKLVRKIIAREFQSHQVLTHVSITDVPFRPNDILALFHCGGKVITQQIVLDGRGSEDVPVDDVLCGR